MTEDNLKQPAEAEMPETDTEDRESVPSLVPSTDTGEINVKAAIAASVEQAKQEAKREAQDDLLKNKEKMLRVAADFENFRKRARRDQQDAVHRAQTDILKEMLPVFDNLNRAVEHATTVQDITPIIEGANMVTRQFEENLAKFGLKRIKAVGEIFDPMLHEAISQEETDEAPPGVIVKEFLSGYTLQDRLVRASMVIVARPPAKK
jgi:molecular chaperone GrpE